MTDYIRRDTAIELMKKEAAEMRESFEELGGESGIYADAYEDAANMLQDMPAADVAEVVYGRWILHHTVTGNPYTECSNCCTNVAVKTNKGTFAKLDMRGMSYCPFCSAKMDGGNDNVSD